MNSRLLKLAAALSLVALIAVPSFAARGTATFTSFVAIGDSYGAGFQSAALNINHQPYGWPAVIAKQVGLKICPPEATATDNCFALPLISFPGLGSSNELQLNDIVSYPPVIVPASGTAAPMMLTFGRPYNNLSVPGYTVGATMAFTGKEANSGLGQVILRGLGSEVDQAIAQKPTFIAIWIGGNDFLGSVTNGTSLGLTSTADFTAQYGAMLDKLIAGAPQAGIVVGTLPASFSGVPFVSTVSRFIINPATLTPVLGPDGNPIAMIATLDGTTVGQIPAGSYVTLGASSFMASGYGIPSTLAAVPPFNQLPNAGKPLPGAVVITPTEASAIQAQIADYNNIIKQAASSRNIPIADITGLFNRVGAKQEFVGPLSITGDFITGGFFSLDGIHPTDLGYTLFANEFIKAINSGYGTHIPLASAAQFLANNATTSGLPFFQSTPWQMSSQAGTALMQMFSLAPAPSPVRYRATHH
jgi:lysophospholipase L1-like esterase